MSMLPENVQATQEARPHLPYAGDVVVSPQPERQPSLIERARGMIAAGGLAAIALTACGGAGAETANDTTTAPTTEVVESDTTTTTESQLSEAQLSQLFTEQFADQLLERFQGFGPDELVAGEAVDFESNPVERGAEAFTTEELGVLESQEEIAAFYASNSERAIAARENLEEAMEGQSEDLERALNGEGYIPVQALVPVTVEGTTYYVDGEVVAVNSGRRAAAGDIYWIYADEDGNIVWDATLRADCANPELKLITPTPPTPPGEPEPPTIDKFDDGDLPEQTGDDADQDPGTPDRPGPGEPGQPTDDDGYTDHEPRPPVPPLATTTTTARPAPAPTTPATTGTVPPSTNPPQTASTSVSTSTPQTNPQPTEPRDADIRITGGRPGEEAETDGNVAVLFGAVPILPVGGLALARAKAKKTRK